jgi:glycerophosphoryl diester phosphodiesterase
MKEILLVVVTIVAFYRVILNFPKWIRKLFFGDDVMKVGSQLPIAGKIAHRGSREEGLPENSIAAFQDAFKNGADVIELDVWLSSDGEIVVHHDETLHRMTGVNKKVVEMEYSSLPSLSRKIKGQAERVHHFPDEHIEKIPKLDDVLRILPPNKGMIIEFKQDSWELIDKVHKLLEAHKKTKQIFWFSLTEKINKNLAKYDPSIPTITSVIGMLEVLFYYYSSLIPFVTLKNQVFGITVEEVSYVFFLFFVDS